MKFRLLLLIPLFLLSQCSLFTPTEPSIVINPGVDTVEINTDFHDAGATAMLGIRKLPISTIQNTVDEASVGEYVIIYETVHNNTFYQAKRIVNVVDTTPPIVMLNSGIDTIKVNHNWIDAGVSVSDNSNQDCEIEVINTVDTTTVGVYTVTYIVTDQSNNETNIVRFVTVIE